MNFNGLIGCFCRSAAKYPDSNAVYDARGALSYREVKCLSILIAEKLHAFSCGEGDAVCVLLPREKEIVAACLGIQMENLAYTPVDDRYPDDRIRYILKQAEVKVLITSHAALESRVQLLPGEQVIFIDDLSKEIQAARVSEDGKALLNQLEERYDINLTPLDEHENTRALILFTSGTTGNPKGVVYTQRALFYDVLIKDKKQLPLNHKTHSAEIASFTFIASLWYLFAPLMFGGETHIIPYDMITDVSAFYQYMLEKEITHVFIPGSMAPIFYENYDMRNLHVTVAGSKLNNCKSLYPSLFTNHYGSTECSFVTYSVVDGTGEDIPLGRPWEGYSISLLDIDDQGEWSYKEANRLYKNGDLLINPVILYVADENGQEVANGEAGELIVHCDYMASEYLHQSELTNEKFFWKDGLRYLKMGDRVRFGEDGNLYYIGRVDYMFKYNGNRVEAGEIEKRVLSSSFQECIRDAACMLKVVDGAEQICLYYESDIDIDSRQLTRELEEHLAEYMLPHIYIRLEKFPRNFNGKIDRKQLPEPESKSDYLCFTSLEAMRHVVELKEEYNITVDFQELLRIRSKKELQKLIKDRRQAAIEADQIEVYEKIDQVPLTFAQAGVYFDCICNPETTAYNIPLMFGLSAQVSIEALQRSLVKIVNAHPIVNSYILMNEENEPVMVRGELVPEHYKWPVIQMLDDDIEAQKQKIEDHFDLQSGNNLYIFRIYQTKSKRLYLFADFHHIIFDGYSVDLFRKDLIQALHGEEIKAEKYDYFSFAADQLSVKETEEWEKLHEFWTSRAAVIDEITSIKPDVCGINGIGEEAITEITLNSDIVQEVANRYNVQKSSVYLAASIYALHVFTGDSKLGLLTVSSGRQNMKIAHDYGMFVNTLLFTDDVHDGSGTVKDFLQRIQKNLMESILHDNYPFYEMASEFGINPEVVFVYQETLVNTSEDEDVQFDHWIKGLAKFPIHIEIVGNSNETLMKLRYDCHKYSEKFMRSFGHAIRCITEGFLGKHNLEEIQLIDAKDEAILNDNNNIQHRVEAGEDTVLSMFADAVTKFRDAEALVYGQNHFTYGELDSLSNRIARRVSDELIGKNGNETLKKPVVAIMIPRCEYILIASLAVLKTGCMYQPIDPAYPTERIQFMLQDTGASLLITTEELVGLKGELTIDTLFLSEFSDEGDERPLEQAITPKDFFTILYTSGSTGTPKGVLLNERNLASFCKWYCSYYDLMPGDKVAAYASYGFDANMMDMYPAITCGACVHVIPEEKRLDLQWVKEYFEENAITHVFFTTQIGVQVAKNYCPSSLKCISVGGEKLNAMEPPKGVRFFNGYGPTECSIFATTKEVREREENIPIGRPTGGINCYILDNHCRLLPIGASGELVLSGDQVGQGYLNRPDLTNEKFFSYREMPSYHTGDIVRYRFDGDIEFVGRKDGMVKIRGFRIELGEIESVIKEFPEIRDVTVQALDDPNKGKYLVAYIVSDITIDTDALKKYIAGEKPPYMVPQTFVQISKIPLNINQKVDKKALPKPELLQQNDMIAPKTEMEKILAETVKEVLGIEQEINMRDSYSDLGGDSINSIRLVSMLRERDVDLNVQEVLQSDSLMELAGFAKKADIDDTISQDDFEGYIENTPVVNYFFRLKLPVPEYFHQIFAYKASSKIDTPVLRQAFKAVTKHHDLLRGIVRDDKLYVRSSDIENLFTIDEFTQEQYNENSICALTQVLARSMSLNDGPLLRLLVLRAEGEEYLIILIHHLLVDGVSWRIIENDLNYAYRQVLAGKKISFQRKTHSYADYSRSLERYGSSQALQMEKEYWDEVHADMEGLDLSNRDRQNCKYEKREVVISQTTTKRLLKECNYAYHTEINDLLLSATGMAYKKMSGKTSVTVCLEGHGREEFGAGNVLDRTVGWFTSIYPVVLKGLGGDTRSVIRTTKEILHHIPMKGMSYQLLYNILDRMPLITFNYLGEFATASSAKNMFTYTSDVKLPAFFAEENHYGTDISINGITSAGETHFLVEMNKNKYSQKEIDTFITGLKEAFEEVAEHTFSKEKPEKTATDYGEMYWTDEEYEKAVQFYESRGQHILNIENLMADQIQQLLKVAHQTDGTGFDKEYVVRLNTMIDRNIAIDTLQKIFEEFPLLRQHIYYDSGNRRTLRLVTTDQKAELEYITIKEGEDFEKTVKSLRERNRFSQDMFEFQMEALVKIGMVSDGVARTCIVIVDRSAISEKYQNREYLVKWFRLLSKQVDDTEELFDWIESLSIMENEWEGVLPVLEQHLEGLNASTREMLVKPYYDCEKKLANMFSNYLHKDCSEIDILSDFYQLGGDDFSAFQLSRAIYQEFKKNIPPAIIRQNPTILRLERLIKDADYDMNMENIHMYIEKPNGKQFFFVHTANTGSEAYYLFGKELDNRCGFGVFEQYNLHHPNDVISSIQDLATQYIEYLKEKQPVGPYHLGGWCYGGLVALEMANQLTAKGEVVEDLIMFDSHIIEDQELRERMIQHASVSTREYLSTDSLFEGMRQKGMLENLISNSLMVTKAWLYYQPKFYQGKILFFKAMTKKENISPTESKMYDYVMSKPACGVEKYVSEDNLTIVPVYQDHDSLMNQEALNTIMPVFVEKMEL